MNNKDLINETGWTMNEIIKRINSFPHVSKKITEQDLKKMSKNEFKNLLLGIED
ncbi:hypothetical protein [Staphylococcus ratti]|uniref:Phage protein n=1 Tax=Staphylococcus ratti TaxID=2892440 RepID=A0ABY3PEY0_9STAP|nr:hypothetical protein [Staphylococcus ratti]UEX90885.1 hypothetical protein LN051_04520 [Staphylococcus ratti]